jgi:Allene oxide cyclase barrel like domain
MSKVVRVVAVGTALVGTALLVEASTASASPEGFPDDHRGPITHLEFDVLTSPFNYTDLGQPGPSAADVIVFNDQLLTDGKHVGHEVGSCVLVDASGLANCTGVVTLDGVGTITFAFENAPPPEKVLAITGGTGTYRSARGEGTFRENGDGKTATLTLSVGR